FYFEADFKSTQGLDYETRVGRAMLTEILTACSGSCCAISRIDEIGDDLDHVFGSGTGCFQDTPQVVVHLPGLCLSVVGADQLAIRITRHLAGNVDGVACTHGMGV